MKKIEEFKKEIDINDRKMTDTFRYLGFSILTVILFIMLLPGVTREAGEILLLIDVLITTFLLVIINYWYLRRLDNYKKIEENKYTLAKHVKENGNVLEGEVLHIREERYFVYSDDEEVELISRELVIRFEENGVLKYIVKSGFPHEVKLTNIEKDDISEIYKDSIDKIEEFKDNCINHYQYKDKEGCIAFTNLTGDMTMINYADSIEKNYEGFYTCKIYSYKGRYVIGDIEGYDYKAEKIKIEKEIREKGRKNRRELIGYILLMIILMIMMNNL